jgi:hypothetical protein
MVTVAVFALQACAENRRTWFIRQNQVFSGDPPDCLVPDDPGAAFRTAGGLDVAIRDDFYLTPLIENQLMKRKDYSHLRDEPNGIQVEGAIVRAWCDDSVGDPDFPEFFSPASSYIDPQDTGASAFIAIHADMVEALRGGACGDPAGSQLVMLGVRMVGITNGGLEIETPEFFYPVFVCAGCLVNCSADADDEDQAGPDCCNTDTPDLVPCLTGQDDAVDCRLCRTLGVCQCGAACG